MYDAGGLMPHLSPHFAGLLAGQKLSFWSVMDIHGPIEKQKPDGSIWLKISRSNPLSSVFDEKGVTRELRHAMVAPSLARRRFWAVPLQKTIEWLCDAIAFVSDWLNPHDDVQERLGDIEKLIRTGYHDAADKQIDRLRIHYPNDGMRAQLLGPVSFNLYSRGNRRKAQYIHEFALLCNAAHPVMVEIFGDTIRGADSAH